MGICGGVNEWRVVIILPCSFHRRCQNKSMNYRETKKYKEMTPYLATAIAEGFCEGEGASESDQLCAWQYLVDTDLVWSLQGCFGRTASALIEAGHILPTNIK